MTPTIDQLNALQRRAHNASYNGNATADLCRVVADLVVICAEQQHRIEELLNVPAPLLPTPIYHDPQLPE